MDYRRIALLPLLFSFACNDGDEPPVDTDSPADVEGLDLIGMDYVLDSAEGFEPVAGSTVRLGFGEATNGGLSFHLHGGCNSIGGDLSLTDGVVTVSQVSMTEMACDTPLMDQDDWLIDFVTASPLLERSEDLLTLTGSDATLVFIDEEVAIPDSPLVDSPWTVDSYIDGDAISTINLTEPPTILFNDDGTVEVFTGCNNGSGKYVATATELTFSEMGYTKMACADGPTASAENYVLSALNNGTSTFGINANRLTVELGGKGVSATTD